VRTARAFGLSEWRIVFRYALPIAVLPTVTILGVGIGYLISSAVFAEIVFSRPGIGSLIYEAVGQRNYPVVMGGVLVTTVLFVVSTTIADLDQRRARPAHAGEAVMAASDTEPTPPPPQGRRFVRGRVPAARGQSARPVRARGRHPDRALRPLRALARALRSDPHHGRPPARPPSWEHWLGTDQIGRDVFSRVLVGGQIALQVALASIAAALTLGLALGLLAGFGPRWLDNLIMLLFDTVRSFPVVIFGLATVTVIGPSLTTIIFIVVVTSIPTFGRVARTQTLAIRNNEFILAERAMGAGTLRILAIHILPNIIGPLLILASMDIPGRHHHRGGAELPRRRRAAAGAELGLDPQ
jgi:ABC-type dipeptide/oligopeptide/nickel transport system permease subunit